MRAKLARNSSVAILNQRAFGNPRLGLSVLAFSLISHNTNAT